MSYRRRGNNTSGAGGVRGPNSALTEFLKEHGINDELIQRRRMAAAAAAEVEEEQQEEEDGDAVAEILVTEANGEVEEEEEDDEDLKIRIAARRKRRLAKKNESDYTDSEDEGLDGNDVGAKKPKKKILGPGQTAACFQCQTSFKITAFSKKVKDSEGNIEGYLCRDCTLIVLEKDKAKRQKELQARKKRRKVAQALLDKEEVLFPSLQDLCIKLVIKYINEIEAFGDIGTTNMNKICRILCKNRLLTDSTLPLFLNPDVKDLQLWDCSKLSVTALKTVASFCPNLERLAMTYAGKLNNNVFDYYISQLSNLTAIDFDGAYLINDDSWLKFFSKFGNQLKSFTLRSNYRFTDQSLVALSEFCPNLELLAISRLDGLITEQSFLLISKLKKLKHLEISHPNTETLVPDSTVIEIVSKIGTSLESLVLDGCTGLTDQFLTAGVRLYCSDLKKLSLENLDQISDVGISGLFEDWEINTGLMSLNLRKCVLLSTNSLIEVINHSAGSLIELNINSLSEVNYTFFEVCSVKKLPLLTILDCGFVRAVDNNVLKLLSDSCPKLKILEVYGNNRCSASAKVRKGLKVIGIQSAAI